MDEGTHRQTELLHEPGELAGFACQHLFDDPYDFTYFHFA
jgi:hypothetical protein